MELQTQRRQRPWSWLWLSVVVIIVDQWSKYAIVSHLAGRAPVRILPFLNFRLAYNTGASFSFLAGESGWQLYMLSFISVAVVIALLIWMARLTRGDRLLAAALSLIIGGAIGNVIDRVRLHCVVDFVDVHFRTWHFATFNVADSAISVGAFLLLVGVFFLKEK